MSKTTYPLSKYRFYFPQGKVIAVSTYAGKTVKGVAKCDPRDEFDLETGKKLAAARCNAKIAAKRKARANKKLAEAHRQLVEAQKHYNKMNEYVKDSANELTEAQVNLRQIEKQV